MSLYNPFLSMLKNLFSLHRHRHVIAPEKDREKKMRNLLRHESQRVSGHGIQAKAMNSTEEKRFLGDHKNIRDFRSSSSSSTTGTKVKIKITKKQLKELLGMAEDAKQI
ncbi:hypothetical protein OIU79_021290 [Salix purpurea]|uniref:Uncharacterized protein n=1 Tax=Salix purpurea TaxID=77065 RepID=A0A9Q1AGV4_SALPP|nr:hypothetical protein OIU79_021290 [Salix purpurea]